MTRPNSILTSPYKDLIDECIESGWSPRRIEDWLRVLHGDKADIPSYKAIYRYRETHMSTARTVPKSLIQKRLGDVDYKVDLLGSLARLLWAAEERVSLLLQREETDNTGNTSASVDKAMGSYLTIHRQYYELAKDLGVVPHRSQQPTLYLEAHRTQAILPSREEMEDLKAALGLSIPQLPPGEGPEALIETDDDAVVDHLSTEDEG